MVGFSGLGASATGSTVDLVLNIAPVLQVVLPEGDVVLNLAPNAGPAVFASSEYAVAIATSNPTGYTCIIETEGDATALKRTEADNFGDFPEVQTLDHLEGGYTQETFTENRWGLKADNGNYLPFTNSWPVISSTEATDGDQANLTFAAKVNMDQPAGAYKLTLNFVTVANMIPGVVTINYVGNESTGGTQVPAQQVEGGKTIQISENTFERTDYNFIGWNTEANGGGTTYLPGATYEAPLVENNSTLTLYAQWEAVTKYIQDFTIADCIEEAKTVAVSLEDERDGNFYNVRYIDSTNDGTDNGNCWMTSNLNFDIANNLPLEPATTNVKTTKDGSSNTGMMGTIGSLTSGNDYSQARVMDMTSNNATYGYLYNYAAASARSIIGDSNSTTEAPEDICPAGWKLPTFDQQKTLTGGTTGSWVTTYYSQFTPALAGNYNGGSPRDVGSLGYYWSSTYLNSTVRYSLLASTTGLLSGYNHLRSDGIAVRCVRAN